MAHALMLCDQKMGGADLFDQFVATIRSKSGGGHLLSGASMVLRQCLVAIQKNSQQKYPNACFYEENSCHNACFIRTKTIA